ncbi:zinc ion binding [Curvularia kusanoi]|uniref:Zinc ion binding n=1 Tax=Curvularia kusanoi TaxID=90978 RepID=A0A9P4TFI7_CURKU|nr:zinc ion binding [Curvularia kusanoi]
MPTPNPLPTTNTSLVYTTPLSPPYLTSTSLPPLAPHTLLIKIHFAAINPVDIQLWGNPVVNLLSWSRSKGIGRDYSGVIVALGSALQGKSDWAVGDAVFGLCNRPLGAGTFAQYLEIEPGREPVARMPRAWGFAEAAGVPLVVLTAWACLDWLPGGSGGEGERLRRVVVNGASGGVGSWCVQLAKKVFGCHVTGVCSGRNKQFVEGLGADVVVDYAVQDVKMTLLGECAERGKYDLYVDCVGGTEMFSWWHELLGKEGAYVTIVGDKTSRTAMGGPLTYFTYPSQIWRYLHGYMFGPRYANVLLYQRSELLAQTARLADEQGVQINISDIVEGILDEEGHTEAWEKVRQYMVGGRVRGKIVVKIVD